MEIVIKHGEYLPHWTSANSIYHVCFRLKDSLPETTIKAWEFERRNIIEAAKIQGRPLTKEEERQLSNLHSEKVDKYLDTGIGKCWLNNSAVASLVASTLMYFDGFRYKLYAWCVMPNHVHVLIEVFPQNELFKIIHSWKSYSASRVNKILNRMGSFWHHDAYNRIIRSEKEFRYQMNYVWSNPDMAGLKNWKYRYMIRPEMV